MVAGDLSLGPVSLAAVDLDGQAVLRPVAVDLVPAQSDVDLRARQPTGLHEEEELALGRAVGAGELGPVDLQRPAQGSAAWPSSAGHGADCIELDPPVVVGFGEDVADVIE